MSTTDVMDTIDEAEQAWNEMLECETSSLLGRVADLERQSLAQRDEIVCLRATLADALRRISQLEGRDKREDERNERRNERLVSSPLRNGHTPLRATQNSIQKESRVRQTNVSCLRSSSSSGSTQDVRDSNPSPRRPVSYAAPSQLPQRDVADDENYRELENKSPKNEILIMFKFFWILFVDCSSMEMKSLDIVGIIEEKN
ncbi:hypothetical protein PV327_005940 [Microctonus hyperodae]|uniref:Uncharacterized protein n=1 Tax=Microctonus hyperodae TaxID=165561 RepID=A0AA39L096_MICHY|nr:hypothetical protein PV327_005940 [Microctonus hyperodae]